MGINVQTLTEDRHALIRVRLAAEGKVLASELAARFGVSGPFASARADIGL